MFEHFLLCEDDALVMVAEKYILQDFGVQNIDVAYNGEQALDFLKKF